MWGNGLEFRGPQKGLNGADLLAISGALGGAGFLFDGGADFGAKGGFGNAAAVAQARGHPWHPQHPALGA